MSSNRADVRDFLVTRRAKITPQQAGLTFYGGNRRVPGLRREEVAMLAGVSADYYTRLEKGNLTGVSDGVLDAIAGALQLDEAERLHLRDLARAANTNPARAARRPAPQQVRPGIQLILDGMTDTPAFVRNGRLDILAANTLGRALYSPAFTTPGRPVNLARFRFLDPAARDFYPDFGESARTTVALLRTEAGRDPFNASLTGLIGELSTRSEEFRSLWAAHDVRLHRTGRKHFRHPAVGTLDLMFETMAVEADEGLTLTAYTAEPGTPSHDGLKLLASWAATDERGGAVVSEPLPAAWRATCGRGAGAAALCGAVVWIAPEVERREPPYVADERTRLDSWLDFQRATLLRKCSGLTAVQLAARPVASSALSLLGLVRHMGANERIWFRIRFAREGIEELYVSPVHPDGTEFDLASPATAEADFSGYAAEVAAARLAVAGRSLDERFGDESHTVDLRWLYAHMLDEYIRHNGHADLIRELVDGTTGY